MNTPLSLWDSKALTLEAVIERALWLAKVVVFPPDHGRLEAAWRAMSAAFSIQESVLPPRALAARLHDAGAPSFVTCRWNDEEAYRLAIECSLKPTR